MGRTRETGNLVSTNNVFSDIVNDRVGIGTITPQYELDVNGDINSSTDVKIKDISVIDYATALAIALG
jgi:hypothetical protein